MRTVILGDVHLGSPLCRTGMLLELLRRVPFDCLVLNGDIFDDINFRRFNRRHWEVMAEIRELSEVREVVCIRGNHDGAAEILRHLLGVPVLPDYTFAFKGKMAYVTHGDEFDNFQKSARRLRKLRDLFYGFALWFDVPRKTAIQWAQRSTYAFERATAKVREGAIRRAAEMGARWVVVGHTHSREEEESGGVTYLNPSSWLTANPAYVLFDDEEEEGPRLVVMRDSRRPRRLGRAALLRLRRIRR